ncbi:MAG: heparinase, partial [Rhodospirillaceae bacterium]|nr:heparinase [Rhodospirillaceae bacterium]
MRRLGQVRQKSRDRARTTFPPQEQNRAGSHFFQPLDTEALGDWPTSVAKLSENYLGHKFDILGSGWKHVHLGMSCDGLEGHRYHPTALPPTDQRLNNANAAAAREIRALMDTAYDPLDWQLDIKSGYRWREDVWYRDIRYRDIPGADAKVPWELARLQHLPQLALAYGLAGAKRPGFRNADDYAREFRNQTLDFIAANPPRFGINWSCAMDVAIRAANLLVAHDLFRAYGHAFDPEFENIFWPSLRAHGRHIVANFERHGETRNNHYLANIVGLLFISAYLP